MHSSLFPLSSLPSPSLLLHVLLVSPSSCGLRTYTSLPWLLLSSTGTLLPSCFIPSCCCFTFFYPTFRLNWTFYSFSLRSPWSSLSFFFRDLIFEVSLAVWFWGVFITGLIIQSFLVLNLWGCFLLDIVLWCFFLWSMKNITSFDSNFLPEPCVQIVGEDQRDESSILIDLRLVWFHCCRS